MSTKHYSMSLQRTEDTRLVQSNAMKLKTTTDEVVRSGCYKPRKFRSIYRDHCGFGLRYELSEIPVVSNVGHGVKAINLRKEDFVAGAMVYSLEHKVVSAFLHNCSGL